MEKKRGKPGASLSIRQTKLSKKEGGIINIFVIFVLLCCSCAKNKNRIDSSSRLANTPKSGDVCERVTLLMGDDEMEFDDGKRLRTGDVKFSWEGYRDSNGNSLAVFETTIGDTEMVVSNMKRPIETNWFTSDVHILQHHISRKEFPGIIYHEDVINEPTRNALKQYYSELEVLFQNADNDTITLPDEGFDDFFTTGNYKQTSHFYRDHNYLKRSDEPEKYIDEVKLISHGTFPSNRGDDLDTLFGVGPGRWRFSIEFVTGAD